MKKTLITSCMSLVFISSLQAEVKIGAALAITGPVASSMPSIQKVLELAKKQVNEQGGLFKTGEKIDLIVGDSACDPVAAVDAAKKLVDVNQVVALVGSVCSGEYIAQSQSVSIPAGVVSISIGATSPVISNLGKGNDLVFRVVPSDLFQGEAIANLALKKGMKDIAVMYSNDDYNAGISKAFIESFKKKGGNVTAVQAYDPGKSSYRSQVATLGKNTKNLALFAYPGNGGITIIRNSFESGAFTNIIGGDSMKNDDVIKQIGPKNLKTTTFTSPVSDKTSEGYKKWEKEALAAGIKVDDLFVANAYDTLFVLALAIEKAGSADRKKISGALRFVAKAPGEIIYPGEFQKAKEILAKGGDINYQGASGNVDFDENGDIKGLYGASTVSDDGKWVTEIIK